MSYLVILHFNSATNARFYITNPDNFSLRPADVQVSDVTGILPGSWVAIFPSDLSQITPGFQSAVRVEWDLQGQIMTFSDPSIDTATLNVKEGDNTIVQQGLPSTFMPDVNAGPPSPISNQNFYPQPAPPPLGPISLSMHQPHVPAIPQTNPFLIQAFYNGAVIFLPSGDLIGPAGVNVTFTKGIISFWMEYAGGSITGPQVGQLGIYNSAAGLIGCVMVVIGPTTVDLYLVDNTQNKLLFTGSMSHGGPPPGWHNYICSWDVSQLITVVPPPSPITGSLAGVGITINQATLTINVNPINGMAWQTITGPFNPNFVIHGSVPPSQLVTGATGFNIYTRPNLIISNFETLTIPIFGTPTGGGAEQSFGSYVFTWDIQSIDLFFSFGGFIATVFPTGWDTNTSGNAPVTNFSLLLLFDQNGILPSHIIRAQMAMDRGGGRVGGPPMDTDSSNPNGQPFSHISGSGTTGTMRAFVTDQWVIGGSDQPVEFAYCYMGIDSFLDITNSANLNKFIGPNLGAVNLGTAGQEVGITCLWMHSGNAQKVPQDSTGSPKFAYNAATGLPWEDTNMRTAEDQPPMEA